MEERLQYLTEREVSQMTRIALQTLRNNRANGRGIKFSRVGRSVRYSLADVIRYMEERKVKTNEN
jgi:predicted DNA-binding transcriptional regulator AlpA